MKNKHKSSCKDLREESNFIQQETFEGLLPSVGPVFDIIAEFILTTPIELETDEQISVSRLDLFDFGRQCCPDLIKESK
jgi:hypothetical protein